MALAIAEHYVLKGLVIGTDRLIRCNPFAFQYHVDEHPGQFNVDGRLLDPVPGPANKMRLNKYTAFSIIPGFGRALAGRPGDGLFSFVSVATLAAVTIRAHQRGSTGGVVVGGSLTTLFWLADFYGASRVNRADNGVEERRPPGNAQY